MSFPRALAMRRAAMPMNLPRATVPISASRQVRWNGSKPDDGDLGGPGGQEPVPSTSGASQSWPTLAAIAAVGLGVGSYLVHLQGKPEGNMTKPDGGELDKVAEKVMPGK